MSKRLSSKNFIPSSTQKGKNKTQVSQNQKILNNVKETTDRLTVAKMVKVHLQILPN